MTRRLRKKRMRRDLRIAAKAMTVQLPAYAINLWKPHRYKVVWGGRGGARSWTVARSLLLMAMSKRLRILCAREIQSSIKDSVHQLLSDQIALMGLTGFTITEREIRHVNGSFFIFAGLRNQITKIKSFEGIDVVWVEEAERISKHSWNILIPTIRKSGSEIWVTFNPDQETDATYQRFILHPPKDCWQQKVSWQDNPWLSAELREEKDYAYATDPDAADWVWGGNIRQFSDAQILKDKWVIREFTIPCDENGDCVDPSVSGPYHGMDFGFGVDPFAAVKCWVKEDCLYIEREAYKHQLDIDATPTFMEEQIPGIHRHTVRGDSARPDSISYIKRHGITRAIGAKKGPGSVEDGIAHLRSYQQIIIHPRCIHVAQEAKLYSYKVDERSGDVLPVIVDKHNHCIDALRYALEPLIIPRVRAGFLFAHGTRQIVCPVCESHLPDDGDCPHCGALVDMITGHVLNDPTPTLVFSSATDDEADDAESTAAIHSVQANGHANGNGVHHPSHGDGDHAPRPSLSSLRLRGING